MKPIKVIGLLTMIGFTVPFLASAEGIMTPDGWRPMRQGDPGYQMRAQQIPRGGYANPATPIRVQQAPQQLQPVTSQPTGYIYDSAKKQYLPLYNGNQPKLKPEFKDTWMWIQVQPYNGLPAFTAIEKPTANNMPAVTGPSPSPSKIADCVFNAKTGKLDCTYPDGTTTQVTPTTDASKKIIAANPTAAFQFSEAGFKEANGLKLRIAPAVPDAGKIVPSPQDVPAAPPKKNPLSSVFAPIPTEVPAAPKVQPPVITTPMNVKLKPIDQMTPAEIEAEIKARGGRPAGR